MITGEQVKAARKLLGWSQLTLALEARVGQSNITKFETGKSRPSAFCVSRIKLALEGAGVEFLEGKLGVELKAKARTGQRETSSDE